MKPILKRRLQEMLKSPLNNTVIKSIIGCMILLQFISIDATAQKTYTRITSTADLVAGAKYIIVSSQTVGTGRALGYQAANNRPQATITIATGVTVTTTPATLNSQTTAAFEITLGGSTGAWTLYDAVNGGYLRATSSTSNNLQTNAATASWTISFATNAAVMTCTTGSFTRNILRYNSASSLFSCYSTGQAAVYLYKEVIVSNPTIALADNNSQVAAANVNHGTSAHILNKIQLGVTTANAILTGLTATTTGTYQASDITNLKVRYSADATLDGADATLSTLSSVATAGSQTFPTFTSQTINSGSTGYIFITADIAATAIHDRTIGVDAIGSSNLTITGTETYTPTPTTTAGGAQTIKDITAPTASTFSPADNATNISTTSNLVITFNENVQAGTGGNWVIYGPGDVVFETISYNSISFATNTATLNPTGTLLDGTAYYVLVDATAVTDVAGNAYPGISSTTAWNFTTTAAAPVIALADNGSQISIANVNHGTTAHVLNKIQLGVSTSNAILTGLNITTTGSYQTSDITNLKVRYSADATLDALDATLSTITSIGTAGAKTFTPFTSQTINSGTTGYIFITADIAATAIHDRTIGVNAIGSSNLTITGATYSPAPTTTAGGAQTIKDITAPTASTFSPTDDATNISTTSNLVITFNENVQAGTSGNWVIYGPGDVVFESIPYNDASISFSTNTVTLNPTGILATETVYYVLIDATAIADVAGNAYAGVSNTTVWNFTTTPPAPTNDLCDAPIPITLNATAISGTMVNATFTTPFTSSPDVWYSFQTTCSGTHTITVTGFTGDIDLGLFGTSCPSTITTLFSATTLTSTETITANLTIGTTYYLRVLAFNVAAQSSTFTVKVDETNCPISIPVATAATPIAYNSFTANWNTVSGAGGYRLDVSTATFPTATDLFISKYVEGSSNNKYIEIFNGTGAAVNLANYVLRLYSNGSASVSQSLTLSGTLNDGEVKIYRHPSANIYSGTTVADPGSTINFNGDDAIALFNNSTSAFADIFGRIGTDPGTSWTSGSFTTVDKTLIRKRTVSGGVTTNPATFATLATEWDQYNVDVVTLLGSHYIATPTPVVGYDDLSVATNSQSVTDISAETNYYYRVRAINGTATTACSNIISLLTLKDPSFADYESAQDGLSTDLSTWNYNSTGSVYAPAIQVPSSGNNILIRSVDSVILAANLTIGSGKTVTVNGAAQLNDYILDGVGAFTLADGAHLLIGSADGISNSGSTGNIQTTTRSFNAGARYSYIGSTNQVTGNGLPNTVTGLTVKKDASNQTLTLSNPVAVQHYLKLEKGTLDLGANDITLLSNTINTAQVLSIANDADIAINYNGTGRFIHQRYFPAPSRRSWRLLTVPLSNTNSVFDSWQNSGTYEAGKGMFITGPGATGVAGNGIDLSSTNGTSLRLWNNNQSYYNLSNTKTSNVSQGTGSSAANTAYFAFVRGDRTPAVNDFGSVASTVTTLSAKGQLQYGDQTFTNIAANSGQFTMIGNPYASPIDWNLVLGNSGTNIQRKIYTWDARLNTVG
ncbi:MAG: beta strand repeat-containing protein, partial [Ferruginibacter sp.]